MGSETEQCILAASRMSVVSCFLSVGEGLLIVIAALGVNFPGVKFGVGLKSKKGLAELRQSGRKANFVFYEMIKPR